MEKRGGVKGRFAGEPNGVLDVAGEDEDSLNNRCFISSIASCVGAVDPVLCPRTGLVLKGRTPEDVLDGTSKGSYRRMSEPEFEFRGRMDGLTAPPVD